MASVGVATFVRSTKGSAVIPVDLGGDTPKAIIIISVGHLTGNDGVAAGTDGLAARLGPDFDIGFATSSSDETENKLNVNDNSSTQVSNRRQVARLCWTGTTFSQDWDVELTSFGPDTVTLNFANAPISIGGHDRRFTLIAFGGSDCEVHLNQQNLGTGTSAIDVTAPGFEPDVVFASSALVSALGGSATGAAYMSFGIGINDGSDTQRCFARGEGAGTLTVSRPAQAIYNNRIFSLINAGSNPTTTGVGVVIGDYDASGYSLTPDASASSWYLTCLAIKAPGVLFSLDDYLTPTATGVENYTGAGFAPNRAFIVGGGPTTINTPINWVEDAATHYFAMVQDPADTTKVGVHALRNRNNVDPTQSANLSLSDGTAIMLGDTDFTHLEKGTFDAFTSDGFDIDFTTVDSTSHIFFTLLMQSGGTPADPIDIEQSGALVVAILNAPLGVYQAGVLAVANQTAEGGLTQSGALIVGNVTPRPFNWVLPEEPIDEKWQWRTDIMTSRDGSEQRVSLRTTPTVELTHKFVLDTPADIRKVYRAMWQELGKPVPMPHYQFKTKLQQPTAAGQSRLYFDPAKTNIRAGGYAFIQQGDTFQIVRVKTILSDGARLYDTIGPVFTVAAHIMPLTYHFVTSGANMKRVAPDTLAELQLTGLDTATISPMTNPAASVVTLPTCDGYAILDRRGVGSAHELAAVTGAERIDNGPGVNTYDDPWLRGDLQGSRTLRIDRLYGRSTSAPDVEWLRTFADYCKGACVPFLAPTWRNDFDLVSAPAGGTTIELEGDSYAVDYFKHAGFRFIALETAAGLIVRRVDSADASSGNSVLTVSEALPDPMSPVTKVSLAPLSRIGDDTMTLTHYAWYSEVTFAIRTVDQ